MRIKIKLVLKTTFIILYNCCHFPLKKEQHVYNFFLIYFLQLQMTLKGANTVPK